MKLSFVIPAYNEEKHIGLCLDSVIKQANNYPPSQVEIIVVNNASTDRTREIAASYPNVKVVNEPAKGLVRARRAGYLASTGDLIANVDSDAILTPGWIAFVFHEFKKNPKLVGLSGPYKYYDLPKHITAFIGVFYYIGYAVYFLNRFILRTGSMLQGGNFVVTRAGLDQIGGYDTSIEFYGEDTDIARRLHKVGDVKFTGKLRMYTTGRRLASEGVFTMANRYAINYFWTIFTKKPRNHTYTDIRTSSSMGDLIKVSGAKKRERIIATAMITGVVVIILAFSVAAYFVATDAIQFAASDLSITEAKAASTRWKNTFTTQIKTTFQKLTQDTDDSK